MELINLRNKIALAIPTYNPDENFQEILELILFEKNKIDEIKICDSSSSNGVLEKIDLTNFNFEIIRKQEFSHAGTRTKIAKEYYNKNFKYIIFMTQDVFLQKNALENLIAFIKKDEKIGVAFGKQEVDLSKGSIFEKYSRNFNYPVKSYTRSVTDIQEYGIKTIFSSDAFAIYDLEKLNDVNFFGLSGDVSEDMFAAHKLIQKNYKVGYCAEAKVYHTHNYKLRDEYQRYKSIGIFYKNNMDMVRKYGKTNSQGFSLVFGELRYLLKRRKFHLVPYSIIRNLVKFIGHKRGIKSAK